MIAKTPEPPYFAVIFSSEMANTDGYSEMANKMVRLASEQDGFLGMESAKEELGITVSYWRDLQAIKNWKANSQHILAQKKGRLKWYKSFKTRIAKVERDYEFEK
ncbi:MAG: antibiotic biosynthesis monooxygenase [Bacteroidetes bacterium]|nr:antibiotic biosynthesis monooxygenase [Bacteroidota bacterium]HET6244997.1 antibiotic biosynthesis monooxygenase [Bacteroidia bacterium]